MAGQRFYLWIGQHENGRYSKAHRHGSSAILICAKGGYTYTSPEQLGMTPGRMSGDKVLRQDYEEGGMFLPLRWSGTGSISISAREAVRCASPRGSGRTITTA